MLTYEGLQFLGAESRGAYDGLVALDLFVCIGNLPFELSYMAVNGSLYAGVHGSDVLVVVFDYGVVLTAVRCKPVALKDFCVVAADELFDIAGCDTGVGGYDLLAAVLRHVGLDEAGKLQLVVE